MTIEPSPLVFPPAPPLLPGAENDPRRWEPITARFVGIAIYAFLVRTVCAWLSWGCLLPVTGSLGVLLAVIPNLYYVELAGEVFTVGAVAIAAMVVGGTASPDDRTSVRRAVITARVLFWNTAYYLASALVAGLVMVFAVDVLYGVWVILVGCLNIPLLFLARTSIRRTRWVIDRTG